MGMSLFGNRPNLLTLADDFGTVPWTEEYPHPTIALGEIMQLLQPVLAS